MATLTEGHLFADSVTKRIDFKTPQHSAQQSKQAQKYRVDNAELGPRSCGVKALQTVFLFVLDFSFAGCYDLMSLSYARLATEYTAVAFSPWRIWHLTLKLEGQGHGENGHASEAAMELNLNTLYPFLKRVTPMQQQGFGVHIVIMSLKGQGQSHDLWRWAPGTGTPALHHADTWSSTCRQSSLVAISMTSGVSRVGLIIL